MYNWHYVVVHQEELCPSPWRVPTRADIKNLDLALGGTGEDQRNVPEQVKKYVDDMGFISSGRLNVNNTFSYVGEVGYMLTCEEAIPAASNYQNKPSFLGVSVNSNRIEPNCELTSSSTKFIGMPVRCLKEAE